MPAMLAPKGRMVPLRVQQILLDFV
ncbi:uncharacterized protein METZ01_LOCUS389999, partial [marine metagenome]